jgi:hypothetical protein
MPRQSSFKDGERGASQSPDNMKVASRPANPRGIMEEGRAQMPKKRAIFSQTYWRHSIQHPDNLHGNSDSRRAIHSGDNNTI